MSDYLVRWSQKVPPDTESWQFRVDFWGTGWEPAYLSPIAAPCVNCGDCVDCWQATFTTEESSYAIQAQAVGVDGTLSEWSNTLYVPEPELVMMLCAGVLALVLWYWRRRGG